MRRRTLFDINLDQRKNLGSSDNKERKIIKTQSELEKDLNIRSYSEFRIKDDYSSMNYEDEDIESKMIRLVILKKKGGNVLENINIKKKNIKDSPSLLAKIQKALSLMETIEIHLKLRKFLERIKKNGLITFCPRKINIIFFQKLKKYIREVYLKRYYKKLFRYTNHNNKELIIPNNKDEKNDSRNDSVLNSPHTSKKKIKKLKMHNNNKNIKVELVTKKSGNQKKSGVEFLLAKIEKQKEKEKEKGKGKVKEKEKEKEKDKDKDKDKINRQSNISNVNDLKKKLAKLNSLKKKEDEYLSKINEKKKKLQKEINLFKAKNNINDEGLSQIKPANNQSDKDSSFFSGQSPSEIGSLNKNKNKNKGSLSEVLSSNDNGSSKVIINELKDNKMNKDDELYSINSEESKESSSKSKKESEKSWTRNSVRTIQSKKLEKADSKKTMRVSSKLSGLNYKSKKGENPLKYHYDENENKKEKEKEKEKDIVSLSEKVEKSDQNEENKEEEEDEDVTKEIEEYEEEGEEEEEEDEEEDETKISFINNSLIQFLKSDNEKNINYNEKNNLVEYDIFYKEQFLKNEVFNYDVENIKDIEVEKINKEMSKLDIKRKLIEKRKLKDVLELKGLHTQELQEEINNLNKQYKDFKKVENKKVGLNLDITEDFYNKGRLLNIYFEDKKERNVPRFSIESSEDIGAQEIIDFKALRKEELIRRYFDYCFCLEQRKKINTFFVYLRYFCRYFVDNWIFDNLSLSLIIINSILIFISDPTDSNNIENRTDNYFLIFYGFEAILKIITFTFYSAEDAYIKDYWNLLDFLVVIIGFISFILEKTMGGTKISGLSGLKAFRILRPLKTVKRFKGLKKLVLALLASVGHLGETVIVLFAFFLFFAIAGLQMWQGLFFRRCMNLNYGYFYSIRNEKYMCSFDSNCEYLNSYGNTYICAKGYLNPNSGAINFDNIGTSFITVFVMVTLEGWSYIFNYVSRTFKDKIYINPIIIFIYFHAFVYIGALYLINLFLAVTNSEFEHIGRNRKKLIEKASFFKLIQSKYDLKEKQKQEKKKNYKKLKIQNNKKSDETLKELYDKVNEEAFHIQKNKRDIPKVYSTVKDIYIMANNNPEELYLEKLRIANEEKSLCADIKRQQREIDELIKEKTKEMDKSKINYKNKLKQKMTISKREDNKNNESRITDKFKTSGINLMNNNASISLDEMKNSSINKVSKNLNQIDENLDLSNIIKVMNKIDNNIIFTSIDGTLKYIEDRINNLDNNFKMKKEEKEIKINLENNKENEKVNQITFFEDTDFEKEIIELNKIKKEKRQFEHPKKRKITRLRDYDQSFSHISKNEKMRPYKKSGILNNKLEDNFQKNEVVINKELSFIDDLSLSSLSENNNNISNITKNKAKKVHTIKPKNSNIFLSNLTDDDNMHHINNLSFDDDIFKNTLFGYEKRNSANIKNTQLESLHNLKESLFDKKSIIETKNYDINNNLSVKTKFKKPHSILNFISKYDDEQKFNDENIRFNLKKYLKKELEKDNEFLNKDRRKSFLGFLEYAQFQKELKELDDLIVDNNKNNINNNSDESLHFLSEETFLSRKDEVSVEDNELLPIYLNERKILGYEYLIHENIKKNLDSNKLTQKIRAEVFDRQSINTNINLTTLELKKFYEETNKNLDEQLYVNKRKIRIRKDMDLNISGIIKQPNYCKYLKPVENNAEQDLKDNASFNKEIENSNNIDKELETRKISINQNTNLNKSEKNSEMPLLNKQKTLKLLNLKVASNNKIETIRESDKNILKFNKSLNPIKHKNQSIKNVNSLNNEENQNQVNQSSTFNKKSNNSFIFKAKSIDKNKYKYPTENSNKYLVKEENKVYTDPLTVKQEQIPSNLRGKKYYMNYLYNIHDKDLKVKDNFTIDHWEYEVLKNKIKTIQRKALPERLEAYFVFNDQKLNLKKYKYIYYNDYEFKDNELTFLTIKLNYLPLNVLALVPVRLRDFGKFILKNEFNTGGVLSCRPNSCYLSTLETNKTQLNAYKSHSGRNSSKKLRSEGSLMMSSAFNDNNIIQDEIRLKKNVLEKIYKKIDDFNYLTLSHYFFEEDKLFLKFIDNKKREEYINKIRESNRKKYNRLNVKKEVENIKIFDYKTNSNMYVKWSGEEVLYHSDIDLNKKKWNNIINSLEDFNMIIWHENRYIKDLQKIRYAFYVLSKNEYFDYAIIIFVFLNSILLALDGNILKPELLNKLNICNYIFNGIFIFEYIVKFIGLSPLVYYSDAFTYLDTIIICFAVLDMATPTNNVTDEVVGSKKSFSSQLSFLRVFRIFRVVRLAKILRKLKSMKLIIVSIKKALTSVYYIVCILVMFILIFELLGMSLLSGNKHYQSFLEGFYTTYQILTLQNWDELFIQMWPLNHLCFIYFVSWIFLGNYILFNLFISILVQSFGENDNEEDDDLNEDELVEKIESLPDYLFILKNKIKDKNLGKIHAQRKIIDRNILSEKYNNSTIFSNSKDMTKYSSSNINLANSLLSMNEDIINEEDEDGSLIFSQSCNESNEEEHNIYVGADKKRREWQKINRLFKNNECENSLYLISQSSSFRIFCMKLINKKWFDSFILLIISLSTLRLVIDTFINGYSSVLVFDICDAVFNIIFLIEALLKIFALGFVNDEGTYLQDNWNKIDALIVCCSFIEFHNITQKYFSYNNSASSVEFLKVLRLLRTLRPLRFISHKNKLKFIITSLFDSIFPIINALFILIVVLFMFSTVGISLFYSYFHNCYILKSDGNFHLATDSFNNLLAMYEIKNDMPSISSFCDNKFNGIMDTGPPFKYSNLITSLITSYILSTMEDWPEIMNTYRIYNEYFGIYFIVFNLVVAYFFLNLFTGIMFKYFNEAYKKEQEISKDDKKAPKYYDFLSQIMGAQSNYLIWNKPINGTFRYYLREIVDNEIFENTIIIAIFLNMITMSLTYEGCPEKLSNLLKLINYLFTFIFMLECFIKLLAYGIRPYFHVAWNKFDFFIVIISIVDWVVADIDGIDSSFLKTFQIIRVLKVLRVSRVIRLVKALKGLEKLIQTLQWSFEALINILTLMILIFSILALLGCYLYDGNKYENFKDKFVYINEYYNFDNFYNSYLLIFRCATGENWNSIMNEMAYREDGREEGYSIAFFILSNFISAIILLNLLLMVTLQQYDEFRDKKYNPIDKFNSFLADFNNAWNKFSTDEDEGFKIKKILLTQFFSELNWRKLNFPEKGKIEYIKKYILELKLYNDGEDYVYYHDVIFKLLYNQMGSMIDRTKPENNLIFKRERKIQKKIAAMINKSINKRKKKQSSQNKKNILNIYNPMTSHLLYKISYLYLKTFITHYKERTELIQHLGETNSEKASGTQIFNSISKSSSDSQEDGSNSRSDTYKNNKSSSINNNENSLNKKENSSSKNEKDSNSRINYISSEKKNSQDENIKENDNNEENLIEEDENESKINNTIENVNIKENEEKDNDFLLK